jgi:hypothetical protein
MLSDLAAMKRLVQLLAAEGRLREMDNRLADAAQNYVDAIRFGNEMSRGAFIINRLVGIACEAIGQNPLAQLVPKLKPNEARSVIAELEKIDATRVTWAEVRRNEDRFSRYQLKVFSQNRRRCIHTLCRELRGFAVPSRGFSSPRPWLSKSRGRRDNRNFEDEIGGPGVRPGFAGVEHLPGRAWSESAAMKYA